MYLHIYIPIHLYTYLPLFLGCLVIGAAYTANLASFLVAEQFALGSVSSISEAVSSGHRICIGVGGSTNQIKRDHPTADLLYSTSETQIYDNLRTGKCSFAIISQADLDQLSFSKTNNEDCSLAGVPTTTKELSISGGVVVLDDSACSIVIRQTIGLHLFEMASNGFIKDAWQKFYREIQKDGFSCVENSSGTDKQSQRLDEKDMGGIFVVHFGVSLVALVAAARTYFTKQRRERPGPSSMPDPVQKSKSAATVTNITDCMDHSGPGDLRALSYCSAELARVNQVLATAVKHHSALSQKEEREGGGFDPTHI
jgi:hypothetical protein